MDSGTKVVPKYSIMNFLSWNPKATVVGALAEANYVLHFVLHDIFIHSFAMK